MVPEDDANACDLQFEIGTVALTEVLPGLRNHPFLRDRLLISFALAQDNAFVIGPVRKKTPSWTAVFMLLKTIFLPRQARDRQGRGNDIEKRDRFFAGLCACARRVGALGRANGSLCYSSAVFARCEKRRFSLLLSPFYAKHDHCCQDRLGKNIRERRR